MELGDLSQALHVVQGAHTRGSLREALDLSPEQILFNDVYMSVGPAPVTDDLSAWRSTRNRFIRENLSEQWDICSDSLADYDLTMQTERLGDATAVVVWVGRGLPEQLLLAWLVFFFDCLELDLSAIWVVQFENIPPRYPVIAIGFTSPEHIREFHPGPRQLNSEEVEELRRAWRVFTSHDPNDLATYVAGTSPMPSLLDAMSQLVDRYPDRRSGLNIWEEALLYYATEKAPRAVRAVGATMAYVGSERLDYVSDDYLFPRLMALGRSDLASPLIKITGSSQIMRVSKVTLTRFGQRVLAGEANHVEVNGIDDWVGGVHLSTAEGNVTFRDGDRLVLP